MNDESMPEYQPCWTVPKGIAELYQFYRDNGLTEESFTGPAYLRIKQVQLLMDQGHLHDDLRWSQQPIGVE